MLKPTSLIFHPDSEVQKRLAQLYPPPPDCPSSAVYGLCRENFFLFEEILRSFSDSRTGINLELLPLSDLSSRILDFIKGNPDIVLTDPMFLAHLDSIPANIEEESIHYMSSLCNFAFSKPMGAFFFGGRASSLHRLFTEAHEYEDGPWASVSILARQNSNFREALSRCHASCAKNLIWYGPFEKKSNFQSLGLTDITHVNVFLSPEEAALSIIPSKMSGFNKVVWLIRNSGDNHIQAIAALLAGLGIEAVLHNEPCRFSLNPQDFAYIFQACPDREWILLSLSVLFQKFLLWKYTVPGSSDFTP